eukprot:2501596-Rhodomonas_salina.2
MMWLKCEGRQVECAKNDAAAQRQLLRRSRLSIEVSALLKSLTDSLANFYCGQWHYSPKVPVLKLNWGDCI